jgi:hypothetical protein
MAAKDNFKKTNQYLATMRKTLRFAESAFGISCVEQLPKEKRDERMIHTDIEVDILDEKCPTFEAVNCNYKTIFEFKQITETCDLHAAFYSRGDAFNIERYLFELPSSKEVASISPLISQNKNDIIFYQRIQENGRYTEKYNGEEGAHAFIARATLTNILKHQNRPLQEVIILTDAAMEILRPENYEATFDDKINCQPMRDKSLVRTDKRKLFGLIAV